MCAEKWQSDRAGKGIRADRELIQMGKIKMCLGCEEENQKPVEG